MRCEDTPVCRVAPVGDQAAPYVVAQCLRGAAGALGGVHQLLGDLEASVVVEARFGDHVAPLAFADRPAMEAHMAVGAAANNGRRIALAIYDNIAF